MSSLLDAMDQTLELGLQQGSSFWGALRENPPEPDRPGDPPPGEGQAFEAGNYNEFRERAEHLNGLEELHVNLGRPGREPLAGFGCRTETIELRGYKRLRMVGLGDLKGALQVCPSCGEGQPLGDLHPARPDPRYYCTMCGSLTPLPETRLSLGDADSESVPIAFPCYRFAVCFHAASDPDNPGEDVAAIPSNRFPDVERLEAAVGCGLRAMLVRT